MPTRVLHLLGIDDTNTVTVRRLAPVLRPSDLSYNGNVEVLNLLDGADLLIDSLVVGGMEGIDVEVELPDVVFSAICDPDSNTTSLDVVERIATALDRPVINPPAAVRCTTRDQSSLLLASIAGVVVPKTIRVSPTRVAEVAELMERGTVAAPCLFRPAGSHRGHGLTYLPGPDDLSALDAFALDGRPYYLTEFIDYASPDGRYRKHRVIVVGGRAHPRHLIVSDHWNVHGERGDGAAERTPEAAEEEAHFLSTFDPDAWPAFEAMHQRLGLDYFGVDYAIDGDSQLVVFEVKAGVRALTGNDAGSDQANAAIAPIKAALVDLIETRATPPDHTAAPVDAAGTTDATVPADPFA